MMKIFAVSLLLALAVSQVFADLYCYSCFSYESEEKCWETRRKIKCAWQDGRATSSFDSCIKFEVDVKVIESINGTVKAVENKGYGMDCGRKRENCFLQTCRNYWGIHGQFLNAGCRVKCCDGNSNSTCEKPDQTPIETNDMENVQEVDAARSSPGSQFESRGFTVLVLLIAKSILLVF